MRRPGQIEWREGLQGTPMSKDQRRPCRRCNAQICPEDQQSLQTCAWFTNDEICHRRDYAEAAWIVRQRRIARVTQRNADAGCFTYRMLSHRFLIRKGIKGIVSAKGATTEAVDRWLKAHPGLPDPSAEQQEEARRRILKVQPWAQRRGKLPLGAENDAEGQWYKPARLKVASRDGGRTPIPEHNTPRWLFERMTWSEAG